MLGHQFAPRSLARSALLGIFILLNFSAASELAISGTFSWPSYPPLETATPLHKPASNISYAPPFASLAGLYPNQTTTSWVNIASPTDSDRYGNSAWSAQWANFNITLPPFTTTVSPTAVAESELIKPTPLPFPEDPSINDYKFPKGYLYGFSGAALQVEGAVRNEGRGPSLTERILARRYNVIPGGGPPDVTNLHYYLYKQDIARLAAVGVQSYSFSISWSRILPFAVPGSPVNREGLDHYDDVINTILEHGMTPIVTLHHFDSPLHYYTNSSWQGYDHPEFVEGFVNYAKIVLSRYSDRVPYWISFNEPTLDAANIQNWASSKNIVNAHAQVVHWYREKIKGRGKWGIKFAFGISGFAIPLDPSNPADIAAAERSLDFNINYASYPVMHGLPPPDSVMSTLGTRAPHYSEEELEYANGTCDFYGIDVYNPTYTTTLPGGTEACARNSSHPNFPLCVASLTERDNWQVGAKSQGTPFMMYQHFRTVLQYLHSKYPSDLGILVGEFGFPIFRAAEMTLGSQRTDLAQTTFYQSILAEVLKAINEDKVKMLGTLGWSWVDNWEWGQYDDRYGVQTFNSTTLQRNYKRAIFDFVDFVRRHS